jgi:hypothetical protein
MKHHRGYLFAPYISRQGKLAVNLHDKQISSESGTIDDLYAEFCQLVDKWIALDEDKTRTQQYNYYPPTYNRLELYDSVIDLMRDCKYFMPINNLERKACKKLPPREEFQAKLKQASQVADMLQNSAEEYE